MTIESHKSALLTQPDPAIAGKPLLRVPLGEDSYSAQDWTACWREGAIAIADEYYLAHGRSLSKTDMTSLHTYVYINRLDPSVLQNWTVAFDRLVAGGVIKQEAPKEVPVQESQGPKQQTPVEFAKEVAQAMERIDTRTPAGRKQLAEIRQKYLLLEAGPMYDRFIADLESRGVYLTRLEQQQLIEWMQNHNQLLTSPQSWAKALAATFPNYLPEEERLSREIDRDDSITSDMLKKHLGNRVTQSWVCGSIEVGNLRTEEQ